MLTLIARIYEEAVLAMQAVDSIDALPHINEIKRLVEIIEEQYELLRESDQI